MIIKRQAQEIGRFERVKCLLKTLCAAAYQMLLTRCADAAQCRMDPHVCTREKPFWERHAVFRPLVNTCTVRNRRTCRELADLVEQLELPGAGHLPDLACQLLSGRLDVELEPETVAVALCALYICSGWWILVSITEGAEGRGVEYARGRVLAAASPQMKQQIRSLVQQGRAYRPTDR